MAPRDGCRQGQTKKKGKTLELASHRLLAPSRQLFLMSGDSNGARQRNIADFFSLAIIALNNNLY
jgi:hypothetical protein